MQAQRPIAVWQTGLSTMRNPRPEEFDPNHRHHKPETINMEGVVPLRPKQTLSASQSQTPDENKRVVSRYHGTVIPPNEETVVLVNESDVIKMVRKAVKDFGKEAATHRFTLTEKQAIAELVYTYRQQGIRTSENEIARIAINFLFYDYQRNKQDSILHKALQSLND